MGNRAGKVKKEPKPRTAERQQAAGKKRKKGEVLLDHLIVLAGAAVFGAGINAILLPKHIKVGDRLTVKYLPEKPKYALHAE